MQRNSKKFAPRGQNVPGEGRDFPDFQSWGKSTLPPRSAKTVIVQSNCMLDEAGKAIAARRGLPGTLTPEHKGPGLDPINVSVHNACIRILEESSTEPC